MSLSLGQDCVKQEKKNESHNKTLKTVTWAFDKNEVKPKAEEEEERVSQEVLEQRRLQKLEKAGIKVLPAAVRYSRSDEAVMWPVSWLWLAHVVTVLFTNETLWWWSLGCGVKLETDL